MKVSALQSLLLLTFVSNTHPLALVVRRSPAEHVMGYNKASVAEGPSQHKKPMRSNYRRPASPPQNTPKSAASPSVMPFNGGGSAQSSSGYRRRPRKIVKTVVVEEVNSGSSSSHKPNGLAQKSAEKAENYSGDAASSEESKIGSKEKYEEPAEESSGGDDDDIDNLPPLGPPPTEAPEELESSGGMGLIRGDIAGTLIGDPRTETGAVTSYTNDIPILNNVLKNLGIDQFLKTVGV
ncbi:hypothetical protein DSO57_1003449 [Entomophthora muscae]|uniref:Uncharacterized protein n=1 Tax=Entomophthora muscae TaxID=34485 RepID=A0ACC2UT88_9FUNG|nr:hypothetical protein DSO57_1003449 [Entomophthora muscae]